MALAALSALVFGVGAFQTFGAIKAFQDRKKPEVKQPTKLPINEAADPEPNKVKRPGARSTILTTPQGVLGRAQIGKRKLLGN